MVPIVRYTWFSRSWSVSDASPPPQHTQSRAFSIVAGEKNCFKVSLLVIVPSGIPNFNK